MKLKKFSAIMLALVLVFSMALAACGEKSNEETKENEKVTTEQKNETEENEEVVVDEVAQVETDVAGFSNLRDQKPEKMDSDQYLNLLAGEPESLDTTRTSVDTSWFAQGPLFEGLTRIQGTESGSDVVEPGVAESWEVNDEGTVYTFHLRDNAKWQDGKNVTAYDFEYAWERILNPETGSPYAWLITPIFKNAGAYNNGEVGVEEVGIEAKDEYTLVCTLEKPTPYFMQLTYFPTMKPLRKDVIDKWQEAYGAEAEHIIANGPYIVSDWIHRGKIVYEKNPNYWDAENVYIEKMTWNMIDDRGARMQSLMAGDIDSARVEDAEWKMQFDSMGEFNVISRGTINSGYHLINCADRYFKSEKIRKAFSAAIDRDDYVDTVTNGTAYPGWWYVPNNLGIGSENFANKTGNKNYVRKLYDDVRAEYNSPKELLIAGLKELGEDEDPANMDVTMQFRGTSEAVKQRGEYYQQIFKEELGVTIKVSLLQYNIVYANIDSRDYQICDVGWNGDYNDPHTMFEFWHSKEGYYDESKTGWSNPEYDGIIEEAGSILDNDKRAELYDRAEEILVYEDCVIAPYEQPQRSTYRRMYIKNLYNTAFGTPDYKYVYTEGR